MTTTESLRSWFLTCPEVQKVVGFNTNYLGEDPDECTIYSMPSSLKYTEDVIGNMSFKGVQKLSFVFALRTYYSSDLTQNLENLDFFTSIKEWMYEQNSNKNFPVISEGEVKSIMPVQTEYVSGATSDTATYQMLCELTYWREK